MHVLIAGATGVVGQAAMKHFAQRGDCAVTAISRRQPMETFGARFRSVDLAEPDACRALAADLGDLTHLVYTAVYEKPGLYAGWLETNHVETNQRMLENLFEPLAAAAEGEYLPPRSMMASRHFSRASSFSRSWGFMPE